MKQAIEMNGMFNAPHPGGCPEDGRPCSNPGETLKDDVLPALGLNVTEAAAQLGVTRVALSRVLNGRAALPHVHNG